METTTTTDLHRTLSALGFRLKPEALNAFLAHATKSRLTPTQLVEQLCEMERREREAINLARRTRNASVGKFKPMVDFDWNHPRQIDRQLVEQLLTVEFVGHGHNVLIRGPSGVGKTTISKNLAHEALRKGQRVRFTSLAEMLADLLRRESLPALERRMKHYTAPHLLIIDELGYLPCDARAADLLYNVISRRHEQRSTVITTNLPFKQWSTLFPNASCVVALVDRFAQHCHTVDIDADSWRHKEAEAFQARTRGKQRGRTTKEDG